MTIDLAAVISAIAAAISAAAALGANWEVKKQHRKALFRESRRLANEVVATTVRLDGLAVDLKLTVTSKFALHGRTGGHEPLITAIEQQQNAGIKPMQDEARKFLDTLPIIDQKDESALEDKVIQFESDLVHLSRLKEKWLQELGEHKAASRERREELQRAGENLTRPR